MNFIDTDLLEMKVVETKPQQWYPTCVSCHKTFADGEKRIQWRLNVPSPNRFHSGSFWTVHCPECAVLCINQWITELAAVNLRSFLPTPEE